MLQHKQNIQDWFMENEPSENMIYREEFSNQWLFVRDRLPQVLFPNLHHEKQRERLTVISTHMSKSIVLPVYEIKIPEQGITLTMRNNFYDWKVSVESLYPIPNRFDGLFDEKKVFSSVYCEGFPPNKVFGSFEGNQKTFTIEIYDDFLLFTFLWLLLQKNS